MSIKVKRVYEPASHDDGYRILVDRLWPRGIPGAAAHVDLWMRDVAPSTELRQWFGHDVARWPDFRSRYEKELEGHEELLDLIRDIESHRKAVTLLFAAHDAEHNEARVLAEVLQRHPAHAHR